MGGILIGLMIIVFGLIPESSTKRTKRDVDVAAGFCVIECVGDYFNRSAFAGQDDDSGSPICRHIKMPELDAICTMYDKGKDCVSTQCAGKPLAEMLLHVASYGCDQHREEFKKFTPCFTENCAYIENSCKTKCGSLSDAIRYTPEQKQKLEAIRKLGKIRRGQTTDDSSSNSDEDTGFEELDLLRNFNLDGVCQYANCYVNCTEKPLTDECGPENYKFFKQVVTDLIPMFFHGLFPNMTTPPQSCQVLMERAAQKAPETKTSGGLVCKEPISITIISLALILVINHTIWNAKLQWRI